MNEHNLPLETHGWGPEHAVFPVSSVSLRVTPGEHPLCIAQREAIARNWEAEKAAKPAFYDGRMVLQRQLALKGGAITGEGHVVPFSAFLWWRRQPVLSGAWHVFGMAVPVSSDGAVIAIRMARHTANAGKVYCAAGSLDEQDIVDGYCDINRNMRREVMEETGLDLSTANADARLYGSRSQRVVSVFRFYRFDLTADEMLERIAEHMRTDEEKEIEGGVAIRDADPLAHAYHGSMVPMLSMFFAGGV